MSSNTKYAQGGDAKAIARIAEEFYGDYRGMFDAHGWEIPDGKELMTSAPALIVEEYGSIRAFEAAHLDAGDIWDQGYDVRFTSLWNWTPETWACIGWTGTRGLTRRDNLLKELSDPFIVVCYATNHASKKSKNADPSIDGKIMGFYLVSHKTGDRDEFSHPSRHKRNPNKWRHALKALRAFSFIPEERIAAADLYPNMGDSQTIASYTKPLDQKQIDRLREIP